VPSAQSRELDVDAVDQDHGHENRDPGDVDALVAATFYTSVDEREAVAAIELGVDVVRNGLDVFRRNDARARSPNFFGDVEPEPSILKCAHPPTTLRQVLGCGIGGVCITHMPPSA
jgi:hypothetical protein